jgi:hypothetical protein
MNLLLARCTICNVKLSIKQGAYMQYGYQLRLVSSLILGIMVSLPANAQLPPPIDPT